MSKRSTGLLAAALFLADAAYTYVHNAADWAAALVWAAVGVLFLVLAISPGNRAEG